MEPRIQYAQTKDGVSIAYWTMGEGNPVVVTPALGWRTSQPQDPPTRAMSARGICQNSGLWHRQGPDPDLTMPTLRYEVGRLLALQTATIALEP